MPLIRTTVAGDEIRLYVLPPNNVLAAELWRSFVESDDLLGLDVETTAINEDEGTFAPDMRLRAVQFGTPVEGWLLDPTIPVWRARIVELLANPCKRFVSHTNFDALWVLREFGIDLGADDRSIDTMPMASLLRPGPQRPKNLKELSSIYIDDQLRDAEIALTARFRELAPKGERVGRKLKGWGFTNIPLDDPVFGLYGGLDSIYVRRLAPLLGARLREAGMARLSRDEQRIERLMTGVQVRGHLLDRERCHALLTAIDAEYTEADARLRETLGFSPRSPKVGPWLEGHDVVIYERTKTGLPKMDAEAVANMAANTDPDSEAAPVLRDLVALAERKNLRTNLGICWRAADSNGFVHPRILTQQAVTGRMSIQRPAMQTFKKGPLRGIWLARPGHVFVGADYHSQEIRLAAAFSGDEVYNRIVAEGLNQHILTASAIFPGFTTKAEMPREYLAAKILDFAQQYGAGPKTIAAQLGVSVAEAKALWEAWNKTYAGLVAWSRYMARYDVITNPWGRKIPRDTWRAYANGNYAIQSSGRDALGGAILALDEAGLGHRIWLPIHDELILEVPEDSAQAVVPLLEEAMFTEVGPIELTATAEIIGRRWSGGE